MEASRLPSGARSMPPTASLGLGFVPGGAHAVRWPGRAPARIARSPAAPALRRSAGVSQDPLHRLGEGLHPVGLAEPGEALLDRQLRALGRRVTAHDDDLQGREQTVDLLDDLQTVER